MAAMASSPEEGNPAAEARHPSKRQDFPEMFRKALMYLPPPLGSLCAFFSALKKVAIALPPPGCVKRTKKHEIHKNMNFTLLSKKTLSLAIRQRKMKINHLALEKSEGLSSTK